MSPARVVTKKIATRVIPRPIYRRVYNLWFLRPWRLDGTRFQGFGDNREYESWVKKGRPPPAPPVVKQGMVAEFGRRFGIRILVETGTYQGAMIRANLSGFDKIISTELDQKLFQKAQRRFRRMPHVAIVQGDSAVVLPQVLSEISDRCIFWLDAHYAGGPTARGEKDIPVAKELDAILSHPVRSHVILIDDARLFDSVEADLPIEEIRRRVESERPGSTVEVENDVICIYL